MTPNPDAAIEEAPDLAFLSEPAAPTDAGVDAADVAVLDEDWVPPVEGVDYGKYPTKYLAIVRAWYANNLKDPYSVRYKRVSKPRKEHAIEDKFEKQAIYGWSVCATVNAKNSFGGYVGFTTTWFLIRNGQIERSLPLEVSDEIYIGRPINCEDGPAK